MEWLLNPEVWIGLLTLTALEIVLGIDNVVFISILSGKLPVEQQARARRLGLLLALGTRILLLFSLSWIIGLTRPLFEVMEFEVTGRSLILILGGLFLLAKSTREIHHALEGAEEHREASVAPSFTSVLVQIMLLDIVFSLDSVITAVGMVDELAIMVVAVVIAIAVMLLFAEPLSAFVERHPTVKMLALSFLLLIGLNLILDGFDIHVPKGYVYFAMGFSVFVEMLNLRQKGRAKPVDLYEPYRGTSGA
jgi:predicted tellurium resistance membrane protein TerC